MKVALVPPSSVGSALTVARLPLLLVTVTVLGPGGKTFIPMLTGTCRFCPTAMASPPFTLTVGAVTVAMICAALAGGLNPAGTPTVRRLVPVASGANAVARFSVSPGLNIAGLPMIVPTAGVPLVTGTLTVNPPRTDCPKMAGTKVSGSSTAGTTDSDVVVERNVVLTSPVAKTNPAGCSATFPVSNA